MVKDQNFPELDRVTRRGYEIRVLGALDNRWADWFNGLEVSITGRGNRAPVTTIIFSSTDQARLRGILNKIWDLNLCVISVNQTAAPHSNEGSLSST
jgi:hypothetical protein